MDRHKKNNKKKTPETNKKRKQHPKNPIKRVRLNRNPLPLQIRNNTFGVLTAIRYSEKQVVLRLSITARKIGVFSLSILQMTRFASHEKNAGYVFRSSLLPLEDLTHNSKCNVL